MPNPQDEWADATEANSQDNAAWNPEKGDVLIGTYTSSKKDVGPNNSMMYNVTDEETGEITGVWGSTVIDNKFEEIPEGSRVRIEYLGKASGKSGNSYKDYSVKYKAPAEGGDAPEVPAPETEVSTASVDAAFPPAEKV